MSQSLDNLSSGNIRQNNNDNVPNMEPKHQVVIDEGAFIVEDEVKDYFQWVIENMAAKSKWKR
jgi:hypothetical protein